MGHAGEKSSEFPGINGLVQLFLMFRAGDVGQVEDLIEGGEIGHVGRGAHRHFQTALLRPFHQNPVAAEHGVGKNLYGDLAAALLLHQFLELFKSQRDVVARRRGVRHPKAEFRAVVGRYGRGSPNKPGKAHSHARGQAANHPFHGLSSVEMMKHLCSLGSRRVLRRRPASVLRKKQQRRCLYF